jgi:8-oxo-dGTP pyrophosphatase MutT (NUDIX family)
VAETQFFVGAHGIIANRGKILVLKRAERMPYQPGAWDLPGGHLCLNETIEECLLREIKEETNLDVAIERLLALHEMKSEPYLQALYACRLKVFQPIKLRPDEHVESRWVTQGELDSLELIPYLRSALSRGVLNYL